MSFVGLLVSGNPYRKKYGGLKVPYINNISIFFHNSGVEPSNYCSHCSFDMRKHCPFVSVSLFLAQGWKSEIFYNDTAEKEKKMQLKLQTKP